MRQALQGRRIDLNALRVLLEQDRIIERFDLIMPRIGQLVAFGRAAENAGWTIEWVDSIDREPQRAEIAHLARSRLPSPVLVVTDDPLLIQMLPPTVQAFHDLDQLPDFHPSPHRTQ